MTALLCYTYGALQLLLRNGTHNQWYSRTTPRLLSWKNSHPGWNLSQERTHILEGQAIFITDTISTFKPTPPIQSTTITTDFFLVTIAILCRPKGRALKDSIPSIVPKFLMRKLRLGEVNKLRSRS